MDYTAYSADGAGDLVPPHRDAASNAVYQTLFDELNERIRNGEWSPGKRLPSIARLAAQYNVSTGSVREALRALQGIGCVTIEHGRGVFVASAGPIDGLAAGIKELTHDAVSVPIEMLICLAETRSILEPETTALAAARGTDSELLEIDRLAKRMEHEAASGHDFVEPDVAFHRLIAFAAHNPVLYRMLDSVNDLFLESRNLTAREPGMTERSVRYHLLIGDALLVRNAPQARLLMLAHMNDTLSSLLSFQARPVTHKQAPLTQRP